MSKKRGGTRASLKRPDIYDELRKERHFSKAKAAAISNAVAAGTVDHHKGRKRGGKAVTKVGKSKGKR